MRLGSICTGWLCGGTPRDFLVQGVVINHIDGKRDAILVGADPRGALLKSGICPKTACSGRFECDSPK